MDGTFKPEGNLARCEVVAILARVSQGYDPEVTYSASFPDVPENAWYANYLGYCVNAGIIKGWADGGFHPMEPVTRSEFAAMACRFLGLDELPETRFPDVSETHWACGYISALAKAGILVGDQTGYYHPNASMTRAAAVKVVNGVLDRVPDREILDDLITQHWFTDVGDGHWAYYHIAEAAFDHRHLGSDQV